MKYFVVLFALFVGRSHVQASSGAGISDREEVISSGVNQQLDTTRFDVQETSDGYRLQYQILETIKNTWWNETDVEGEVTVIRLDDQKEVARKTYAVLPEGQVMILFKDFYSTDKKFPKNSQLMVYFSELDEEAGATPISTLVMTQENWDNLRNILKPSPSERKSETKAQDKRETLSQKQAKPYSVVSTKRKVLLLIGAVVLIGLFIFRLILVQGYKKQLKIELEEQIRTRIAERNKNK
ncbi:hypothetical protein RyT2_11080 [Pseudolactococcus yaeyamensis]